MFLTFEPTWDYPDHEMKGFIVCSLEYQESIELLFDLSL